jgi:hypothetical protein
MTLVMKLSPEPALRWVHRALLSGAILMLGYCCFVQMDTWMFQRREQAQIATIASPISQAVRANGLIGRMEILRLGVSVAVVEGDSEATLRLAAVGAAHRNRKKWCPHKEQRNGRRIQ